MSQNGPNMTPRWPSIDLKIIKKHGKIHIFAGEVQLDPKMAQNGARLTPDWTQEGPKVAQDSPSGLSWGISRPSLGHLWPLLSPDWLSCGHLEAITEHLGTRNGQKMARDSPLLESRHQWKRYCQSVSRPTTPKMAQNGPKVARDGPLLKSRRRWKRYCQSVTRPKNPKMAQNGPTKTPRCYVSTPFCLFFTIFPPIRVY